MAEKKEKSTRQQLSKIAGVETSHARVRTFLSDHFINQESATNVHDLKEKVEEIKKIGAPERPKNKPQNPGKKASEADKKAYADTRKEYDEQMSKYNKFVSDEYVELKVAHVTVKHLMKMEELLTAKKANEEKNKELNKSGTTELKKLQDGFSNINKYKNETADAYAKRSAMHDKVMKAVGKVNTANIEGVQSTISKLKDSYSNISILLEKDEWSRRALRINEQATIALATIIDQILIQMSRHTMTNTLKIGKAIIQPDNCVSEGIEESSLFPLINNLPHYVAIEERQERRATWLADKKEKDDEAAKKARAAAKRKGDQYKRPVSKVSTFEMHEVKEGHAIRIEEEKTGKDGKKKIKTRFLWYDIDIERDDDDDEYDDEEEEEDEERSTNFNFYAKLICLKVVKEMIDEGHEDYDKIRLSKPTLKFFSNIAIDFIARVSPLITELITFKGSSTITDEVVKVALRTLLLDSRSEVDGTNILSDDHEDLMNIIDSKVRLINEYQTKAKTANNDDEAQEGAAEDHLDDEEIEEEIEEETKPPVRRRRQVKK